MNKLTKVVIVEDDQAISQMYRLKFEMEGYQVETAANGKLGLELIEKMRPDIVLTDVMMPVMDGAEMLKALRETDWGKDITVIVLTNMGEEEAPRALQNLGVKRFIIKSNMTPRQVAETVKNEVSQGNQTKN